MPSHNGRFGASGGVGSSESEHVTSLIALVQAFAIPPPAAKPLGRYVPVALRNTADFTQYILKLSGVGLS